MIIYWFVNVNYSIKKEKYNININRMTSPNKNTDSTDSEHELTKITNASETVSAMKKTALNAVKLNTSRPYKSWRTLEEMLTLFNSNRLR